MRLLVLEPHASGHHAIYLRWLLQATKRRHWNVVIATTETALTHPALKLRLLDFDHVTIHPIQTAFNLNETADRTSRLIRREFAYWKIFKETVEEVCAKVPIDGLVLPYVDYCFYAIGILGAPFKEIPWCGISMRLSMSRVDSAARMRVPWKWRIAKRMFRQSNLKALFVINPSVKDVPPTWYTPRMLSRLRYLADPAESGCVSSRSEARAALGLSETAIAILVFGSIDERKGIDALVRAIATAQDLNEYVVLLAGKRSASSIQQMSSSLYTQLEADGRLIMLDRFLSESEQADVFAAADVVWVGYRKHIYMSGVLVLAGRAGLPVVGTSEGEIGRLIETHALGAVARIEQPADVERALLSMRDRAARIDMGKRAQIVFEAHTVENFGDSILSAFD